MRTVERPDQWTLQAGRDMPLYKFAVDDGAGTEVYVSPRTGEVRLVTTTKTRTLAWIATIPHWFYITPLRANQPLWYWTVVGASATRLPARAARARARRHAIQQVDAISLVERRSLSRLDALALHLRRLLRHLRADLGLQRPACRWSRSTGRTPTASRSRGDALTGGPVELEQFPAFAAAPWTALLRRPNAEGARVPPHRRRALLSRALHGHGVAEPDPRRERLHQPYPITGRAEPQHMLVDARTLAERTEPFATEMLLARLRAAAPGATSSRTSCSRTTTRTTTRATARPRCPCCA